MNENTTIEVIVKMRPARTTSDRQMYSSMGSGKIKIEKATYEFDAIVTEDQTSQEFYERHVDPAVLLSTEGFNACIMCYGFTGGGKTFTMFGNQGSQGSQGSPGVVQYAAQRLLEAPGLLVLKAQVVEIYLDKIYDLLDVTNPYVRVTGEGLIGASELLVTSAEKFQSVLNNAVMHRQTAMTGANISSSRSHCIVIFRVSVRNDEDACVAHGTVFMVDLAGCERQSETQNEGLTLRESQSINRSVFAINKVVLACSSNNAHIPYRDSKITMVLHEAFGGNSKTVVVLCCDGSKTNETVNALRFGERCRMIRNKALKTIDEDDPRDKLINDLRNEIESLKLELEVLKTKQAALELWTQPASSQTPAPSSRQEPIAIWEAKKLEEIKVVLETTKALAIAAQPEPLEMTMAQHYVGKKHCC
jgi:kinesin family protein 5